MKRKSLLLCIALLLALSGHTQQVIDLLGTWQLAIGHQADYKDNVILPGSLLTNNKGEDVTIDTKWTGSLYDSSYYFNPYMEKYRVEGQMKFPFFLTPERHYVGKAWYKKEIYVPQSWERQHITLFLERPHIETTVFVNGQNVGHQLSLSTPHQYDVTQSLIPGQRNTIAICVYNGIENVCVGQDSHSVTDQTQGNWNGIIGRMELCSRRQHIIIKEVKINPEPLDGMLQVKIQFDTKYDPILYDEDMQVVIVSRDKDELALSFSQQITESTMDLRIPIRKSLTLWDEFNPKLYRIGLFTSSDSYETTFGIRQVHAVGRQLYINNRPAFLRGTVENCCFPETGYPPTDEASWISIFMKMKEYGLNHMRFHSYCPPEAAFAAADKTGIYLQPEGPSWPNHDRRSMNTCWKSRSASSTPTVITPRL